MPWEPSVRKVQREGRKPFYILKAGGRVHHLGIDRSVAYDRASKILASGGTQPKAVETVQGMLVAYMQATGRKPQGAVRFGEWAGTAKTITDLQPTDLQHFAGWLKTQCTRSSKKPLARWTIRHYVADARQAWDWGCEQQGWDLCKPVDKVKTDKPVNIPRDMPLSEVNSSIKKLNPRAAAIAKFIASEGCRPSEARKLKWPQVNFEHSCITLGENKADRHGKSRTIYLIPDIEKLLHEQPRINDYVFNSRFKRPYTKAGLRSVLSRAGIRSTYSLRHTFAQWFLDHGGADGGPGDKAELQEWLGHSDGRMTDVYAQVRSGRLRQVAKRLKFPLEN